MPLVTYCARPAPHLFIEIDALRKSTIMVITSGGASSMEWALAFKYCGNFDNRVQRQPACQPLTEIIIMSHRRIEIS